MDRTDELEAFKTEINLSELAASEGYVLDAKATSRNSAVMRHPKGDKIILARGTDRHWIYFAIGDGADRGTVIDFLQNRGGGNLGEIRKTLREWLSGARGVPEFRESTGAQQSFALDLQPISRDLARVRADYHRCFQTDRYPYLENVRKIPSGVLTSKRFSGRILRDERSNTIFPHWNREGVCGFEIKNEKFTGFSPGGEKGLWCSRAIEGDPILVIAETAIDALSYAALKGKERMRYVSTGGEISPQQGDLIRSAFLKLPQNGQVILALDHDSGGEKLGSRIKEIYDDLKNQHPLEWKRDIPQKSGADWNDVLRSQS
jgi:hypothetical protein